MGSVVLEPIIVLKRDSLLLEEVISFKVFCSASESLRRDAMFTFILNKTLFQIVAHILLEVCRIPTYRRVNSVV
jgi:hypothetical protein